MTPFEAVYGYVPHLVPAYESGITKVDSVEQSLKERDNILSLLKNNLVAAQGKMKVQADKKRIERVFEVGDWVYLILVPYQHKSLATHHSHKLQPRFNGPFRVLAKVGNVAYKIQLPNHSKLHHVFHVSCLKKHLGENVQTTIALPVFTDTGILQEVPIAILARRMVKKGDTATTEALVQWQNHSKDDATWENYHELKLKFPEIVHL
ncbi:unnamed protein product [Malus baccata var. baccata]